MKHIYIITAVAVQGSYSMPVLHFKNLEDAINFCTVEAEAQRDHEDQKIVVNQGEDDNYVPVDLREPDGWNIISWSIKKVPLF